MVFGILNETRRIARSFFIVALILAAFAVWANACSEPYHSGFVSMTVPYDQPFPMAVWYPTEATEKPWKIGSYHISATPDAPIASGRFPLLVLSHGSGGSEIGHHDWAETLARHGFIVITPRHLGDSFDQPDGRGSDIQLIGRLWQVTKGLDAVLADARFVSSIAPNRIGMIGFSAGGYTTLGSVGAKPNFDLWQIHCDAHREDHVFCLPAWRAWFTTLPRITRSGWALPRETRIKAAVVMAPAGILFDEAGLSGVTVPLRVYRAADDHVVRNVWNADVIIAGLPTPPEKMTVPGGHYVFLAPPFNVSLAVTPELFEDDPGVDRVAIHEKIGNELVEFFMRTLPE